MAAEPAQGRRHSGWGGMVANRSVSSAPSAALIVMPRVAASIRSTAPPMSVNGTYTPASVSGQAAHRQIGYP